MFIDPLILFLAHDIRMSSVNIDSKYDIADVTTTSKQGMKNPGFSVSNQETLTISSVKIGDNPYYGEEGSPTEENIVLDSTGNVPNEAIVQRIENPYYEKE